jgi:hypothetical protein
MLGDFGTERPAVEESFGFFGAVVRVNPDISDLAVIEMFCRLAAIDEAEAASVSRSISKALIHPDDVDLFLRTAVAHRQTIEDLVTVGLKIIEALTARPTQLPSASSDGQPTTTMSSGADSSSRALQLLDGRPDLQVAVLRAQAG